MVAIAVVEGNITIAVAEETKVISVAVGGSGSSVARYPETFDSTDLDGSGDLVITHNKGYQYPQVTVVMDTEVKLGSGGYKVTYDSTTALTLRILGAGAFTGWRVEIL